jgi:putative transposase
MAMACPQSLLVCLFHPYKIPVNLALELYICWKQYLHHKFKILHNPGGAGIECTPATDNIMLYYPEKHHRQSIRLKGYDYGQEGAYFVTICVQDRKCLFGDIMNGEMRLNNVGNMIRENLEELSKRFKSIFIDEYIIMPDHLHGILIIQENIGASLVDAPVDDQIDTRLNNKRAGTRPAPTKIGLADVIGSFKSITTHKYINGVYNSNWPPFNKRLWQRNYYEHIIRNEDEYYRIKKYIIENPSKWNNNNHNPENTKTN